MAAWNVGLGRLLVLKEGMPGHEAGVRESVPTTGHVAMSVSWTDVFHWHACPQCFRKWECGRAKCKGAPERFCPYGPLCHVGPDGQWTVSPKYIQKLADRGVGPLFDRRGIPCGPDGKKEE